MKQEQSKKKEVKKENKHVKTIKKDEINYWKWFAIGISVLLILDIIFTTQQPRFQKKDLESIFIKKEMISDNILFVGDSITANYPLQEFYEDIPVVNSGVNGNKTQDILNDLEERIYRYNPSKIFLLIGTNDLVDEKDDNIIYRNIEKIITSMMNHRPHAKIYVESIYPNNKKIQKEHDSYKDTRNNDRIQKMNQKIKSLCRKLNITYIDVYSKLIDSEGSLKSSYTTDGLHLSSLGYLRATKTLMPYIEN